MKLNKTLSGLFCTNGVRHKGAPESKCNQFYIFSFQLPPGYSCYTTVISDFNALTFRLQMIYYRNFCFGSTVFSCNFSHFLQFKPKEKCWQILLKQHFFIMWKNWNLLLSCGFNEALCDRLVLSDFVRSEVSLRASHHPHRTRSSSGTYKHLRAGRVHGLSLKPTLYLQTTASVVFSVSEFGANLSVSLASRLSRLRGNLVASS